MKEFIYPCRMQVTASMDSRVSRSFFPITSFFRYAPGMRCQDITPGKQVEPAFGEVIQFQGQTGVIG